MAQKRNPAPAARVEPYRVFLSHATVDKFVARCILEKVEAIGAKVFIDDGDIEFEGKPMATGNGRRLIVYLTHAFVDSALAEPIRQALSDAGFVVREPLLSANEDAARAARETIRDSQAIVVLLTQSLLRSTNLPIELGMALAWGTPVFVLLDGVDRHEMPAYLWNNLAVPVDRVTDVIDALRQIAEPITDTQRQSLAEAYEKIGVPVDRLMSDRASSDQFTSAFRSATGMAIPTANLLRELLNLRKRGQLPRLRTSA